MEKPANGGPLRPGDVVEVRSAAEIVATLDRDSALHGTVFMPEMIAYVGQRFTVSRRVDKVCNMVDESGSRRMRGTVYLEDLRCDGSSHGGCQAGCRIYWKEEWLSKVGDNHAARSGVASMAASAELERTAGTATHPATPVDESGAQVWRCQSTDALKASEPVRRRDFGQYWRELTNGNFKPIPFVALLVRAIIMDALHHFGLIRTLPLQGPSKVGSKREMLGLQPGELVRVRSAEEIAATLDHRGESSGLSFDREMLPHCGGTFRVKTAVRRIVDEKTGRMLKIPKDCIILDGVACSGELSVNGRWFCPRAIYPFWRESWLTRVGDAGDQPTEQSCHR
ncbi:hypothetical protein [Mesorhizobium sp. B1-1-5]|uniref:hypothetical protein n=1 Tax=Mesorhizobium sp. B1-1-5 TaxID=2589979 RepID=UPI00112BA8D8|nr:hypothetical protein [Mesorhizobium sp. B1-1-5]TPO10657.1 hypothetical protein FJ980_07895 [Mesorhizobium sp. B1-1-5]